MFDETFAKDVRLIKFLKDRHLLISEDVKKGLSVPYLVSKGRTWIDHTNQDEKDIVIDGAIYAQAHGPGYFDNGVIAWSTGSVRIKKAMHADVWDARYVEIDDVYEAELGNLVKHAKIMNAEKIISHDTSRLEIDNVKKAEVEYSNSLKIKKADDVSTYRTSFIEIDDANSVNILSKNDTSATEPSDNIRIEKAKNINIEASYNVGIGIVENLKIGSVLGTRYHAVGNPDVYHFESEPFGRLTIGNAGNVELGKINDLTIGKAGNVRAKTINELISLKDSPSVIGCLEADEIYSFTGGPIFVKEYNIKSAPKNLLKSLEKGKKDYEVILKEGYKKPFNLIDFAKTLMPSKRQNAPAPH